MYVLMDTCVGVAACALLPLSYIVRSHLSHMFNVDGYALIGRSTPTSTNKEGGVCTRIAHMGPEAIGQCLGGLLFWKECRSVP